MTKKTPSNQNEYSVQNTIANQTLSLEQQQEQLLYLEPFYSRLIGMSFSDSSTAIEQCRELCAEFGFTVKQEASTHRNIYVYCSREGLPDSLRNPKSNPQRKRPSKRCDCRWRVVLYENEQHQWEFRKSLNPEAGKHNHELMKPEEIERSWPQEVTDLIYELARLKLTTQVIRNRVKDRFPKIHWNERRFYNRLSEERQKIKSKDSTDRTHELNTLCTKICTMSAGSDELFQIVKSELTALLQSVSDTAQIDPASLPSPLLLHQDEPTLTEPQEAEKSTVTHKGYLSIEIPKQIHFIKIHNQRQLNDTQLLKNHRRVRPDDLTFEPAPKQSRKGKTRQTSPVERPAENDAVMLQPSYRPLLTPRQPKKQPNQPIQPQTTFVYYDSSMSIDTSLSNYVPPSFHNYTISSPGYSPMSFAFHPQTRPTTPSRHILNNPLLQSAQIGPEPLSPQISSSRLFESPNPPLDSPPSPRAPSNQKSTMQQQQNIFMS